MNTGILSSRYATALLRYTQETGGGERVCAQVQRLLEHPEENPGKLEPELERFVRLLVKNDRLDDVRFIFRSFLTMYYRSLGILVAHLTTAVPAGELEDKLRSMLEKKFGGEVRIESRVDPDLVGGFTLEVGDYLLDATARSRPYAGNSSSKTTESYNGAKHNQGERDFRTPAEPAAGDRHFAPI